MWTKIAAILIFSTLIPAFGSADGGYHGAAPRPHYPPHPFHPGNGRGRGDGRMHTPPPRNQQDHEVDVANMVAQALANKGCDRAGEALRNLSNVLLSSVAFANGPEPIASTPGDERRRMREKMRQLRWRGHMRNPLFWQAVWARLAETYRECDLECFDDGVAVGQISGAGYCAASIGVGGLNGPGTTYQPPLPLCQNATFAGCQVGYDQAANGYQGCSTYTSGGYTSIFNEFKSQDCKIEL